MARTGEGREGARARELWGYSVSYFDEGCGAPGSVLKVR
jgi:hypothetical protein